MDASVTFPSIIPNSYQAQVTSFRENDIIAFVNGIKKNSGTLKIRCDLWSGRHGGRFCNLQRKKFLTISFRYVSCSDSEQETAVTNFPGLKRKTENVDLKKRNQEKMIF
jgi:hypothetical protein